MQYFLLKYLIILKIYIIFLAELKYFKRYIM